MAGKDNNNQEKGYNPNHLFDEQEDPEKVKNIFYINIKQILILTVYYNYQFYTYF